VSMTANSKGLSVTGYTTSAELIGGGISYKNKGALELSAAEAIEVQIVTMKMII
jgi:hypothetical protein